MGVATESFVNPKYGWSLNPVVCTVYNSAGEAHMGGNFTAKYTIDQTSTTNLVTYLPLGNKEETLFSAALGIIDGTLRGFRKYFRWKRKNRTKKHRKPALHTRSESETE